MALRVVVDEFVIGLNPRDDFTATIPAPFLEREPDRELIVELWENFRSAVNAACRIRRFVLANRHARRAAFTSGMENLCADFSRRTENVKVNFEARPRRDQQYSLRVVKLSDIPESCRNVQQSFVAEIPPREIEVQAQFISYADEEYQQEQPRVLQSTEEDASVVRTVPVEVFYEPPSSSTTRPIPAAAAQQQQQNSDYVNPPVAFVATAVPQTAAQLHQSALVRMQELESIKGFLSELEYTTKRRAILDSI